VNILVVGGAGYIGSHMIKMLHRTDHQVVILDNLSTGYADAVRYGTLVVGDMADATLLNQIFAENRFDAVMHFAAASIVGESTVEPAKYYHNNVANTLTLLDAMVKHGVLRFIFSSTAATFGTPMQALIDETHPQLPINPYGRSKLMVETILSDYDAAYNLKSIKLRYFNAAGADPEGELGERHDPETHLIPLVLQVASGRRESINVFGTDYDTPDGTCLRDYIHVTDLCTAHLLALNRLIENGLSGAYNLGNGEGFSVQAVIDTAIIVTGKNISIP
jgi:UDP-glucose 4-epimerase